MLRRLRVKMRFLSRSKSAMLSTDENELKLAKVSPVCIVDED